MKQEYVIKSQQDADKVVSCLKSKDSEVFPFLVTISDIKNIRSLMQNKLMWLWYAKIRDWINEVNGEMYDIEGLHEKMKRMFLIPIIHNFKDGIIRVYSTKNLNTKEFTEFLEKIDMYCADRLNLILPHPNDIYEIAIGRMKG
jgi:hypothetical protein